MSTKVTFTPKKLFGTTSLITPIRIIDEPRSEDNLGNSKHLKENPQPIDIGSITVKDEPVELQQTQEEGNIEISPAEKNDDTQPEEENDEIIVEDKHEDTGEETAEIVENPDTSPNNGADSVASKSNSGNSSDENKPEGSEGQESISNSELTHDTTTAEKENDPSTSVKTASNENYHQVEESPNDIAPNLETEKSLSDKSFQNPSNLDKNEKDLTLEPQNEPEATSKDSFQEQETNPTPLSNSQKSESYSFERDSDFHNDPYKDSKRSQDTDKEPKKRNRIVTAFGTLGRFLLVLFIATLIATPLPWLLTRIVTGMFIHEFALIPIIFAISIGMPLALLLFTVSLVRNKPLVSFKDEE